MGLAILFGGLVFLLYPRSAVFSIDSLSINEQNSTFYDGDQLMTNWDATAAIDNNNFYPINIKGVRFLAFLDNDRRAPIGSGRGSNFRLPARSKSLGSLAFQMPVYAPSTKMPSLIGECLSHDRVKLYLEVEVDLSITHWSGKWLPLKLYTIINCQFPAMHDFAQAPRSTSGSKMPEDGYIVRAH
jgi:hypothetical protein